MHGFINPARADTLKLHHWMKEQETEEPYPFARFNRKMEVVRYADDEYERAIAPNDKDWTKVETDHLFELCEQFGLRFIIVADRFESSMASSAFDHYSTKKRDTKAKEKDSKKATKVI
jgi:DNA methyltransferase 1-associated protein 1